MKERGLKYNERQKISIGRNEKAWVGGWAGWDFGEKETELVYGSPIALNSENVSYTNAMIHHIQ